MTQTAAKPGMLTERNARLTPKPQLAAGVTDVLGLKLTAYIAGVKDTRTVANWAKTGEFDMLKQRKLQGAFAAINLLHERYGSDEIAPWFTFISDVLNDTSPAATLRNADDDNVDEAASAVLAAARAELAD